MFLKYFPNTLISKSTHFYLEETLLGLELASQNYQWILQEASHTIDLLSIKIDKYQRSKNRA